MKPWQHSLVGFAVLFALFYAIFGSDLQMIGVSFAFYIVGYYTMRHTARWWRGRGKP